MGESVLESPHYTSLDGIFQNTLKTKNFGQFKFRTSVCPKFHMLITYASTLMLGKEYKK